MLVAGPVLYLEPKLGQDFQPSRHLMVGLLPSAQPHQRGVVSAQDKLPPIEVGFEKGNSFDDCQQLPPSYTIIPLGSIQRLAVVGDYSFLASCTWESTAPTPVALASVSSI